MKIYWIVFVIIIVITIFLLYRKISFMSFKNRVLSNPIPKKNIGIITLENRNLEMNKYHNQSLQKYANKHGYDYLFYNDYKNDEKELPIYWKKIQIVLDLLKNHNYDYVMWTDSDVIIKDYDIPIESIYQSNRY